MPPSAARGTARHRSRNDSPSAHGAQLAEIATRLPAGTGDRLNELAQLAETPALQHLDN